MNQTVESTVEKESAIAASFEADTYQTPKIEYIMPFHYDEDEHYYVENLGALKKKPVYSFFKRLFDIVFSFLGLTFMALPMLVIAIVIKCTSKGPVFYAQERLGLNGKEFHLIKFRTMIADAEKNGAQWSQGDVDNRITKIGAFLRKTRMDELPQLWQCLIGQISIVGPRPERPIFYAAFETHVHGFTERTKVKPGITGLAQVNGGYNLRPEEKVQYDVEYIKKRSLWLEFKILLKTVKVVLSHDGAK